MSHNNHYATHFCRVTEKREINEFVISWTRYHSKFYIKMDEKALHSAFH